MWTSQVSVTFTLIEYVPCCLFQQHTTQWSNMSKWHKYLFPEKQHVITYFLTVDYRFKHLYETKDSVELHWLYVSRAKARTLYLKTASWKKKLHLDCVIWQILGVFLLHSILAKLWSALNQSENVYIHFAGWHSCTEKKKPHSSRVKMKTTVEMNTDSVLQWQKAKFYHFIFFLFLRVNILFRRKWRSLLYFGSPCDLISPSLCPALYWPECLMHHLMSVTTCSQRSPLLILIT